MKFKRTLTLIVLVISAIALGSFIGSICSSVDPLSWLNYTVAFSMGDPVKIDIKVISIVFGFTFSINIAQIIMLVIVFDISSTLANKFSGSSEDSSIYDSIFEIISLKTFDIFSLISTSPTSSTSEDIFIYTFYFSYIIFVILI